MIFSDPSFLFFVLPITVALFYLIAHRVGKTAAMAVLFASSLVIYMPWGGRNVLILMSSVFVNFSCASILLLSAPGRRAIRISALIAGQLYNLLTLIWFKYTIVQHFYYRAIGAAIPNAGMLIPIGISFYTFQQASVLADAYSYEPSVMRFLGELRNLRDKAGALIRYGFFVTFFPHMIIGPIAYLHEIQPQIASPRFGRLRQVNISVGLMLIGIGLFKKLVFADNLGVFADPVFSQAAQGGAINTISAWLGVFAYYMQLYFDFSGYSDMALGLARLFGIVFPINFYSPLKAVGIVDFYRRWHMTLTRVISRFMFSPLSILGTRYSVRHRFRRNLTQLLGLWIPLLLNFEVIGLWHGARWTFFAFGAIHGLWYVSEVEARTTKAWKYWKKQTSPRIRRILGRVMFLVPMALTFAIFRSESFGAFLHLLRELLRVDLFAPRSSPTLEGVVWSVAGLFVIYVLPNSVELLSRYRPGIMTYENVSYGFELKWRPTWAWAVLWIVLVLAALHFVWRQSPFLYMGF